MLRRSISRVGAEAADCRARSASDTSVRGINVKLRILSALDFYLACINVSSRWHCKNFTSSSKMAKWHGIRSLTAQGLAFSKD